jgi:hypothetical protein
MAKLMANGTEYARLVKDGVCVSVRSNRHILRKVKVDRGWSGWKRWFALEPHFAHPDQTPADAVRFLKERGYRPEGE